MIPLAGCTAKCFGFKLHIRLAYGHTMHHKLGRIIIQLYNYTSISIIYYMVVLHAYSSCFITKSLATRVPFQSPPRARVTSPQVQPPSAPPRQAGCVPSYLELARNPNSSSPSLPVQLIHKLRVPTCSFRSELDFQHRSEDETPTKPT